MSNKSYIILFFLFLSLVSFGQEKDFQIWTEFDLEKKINKDFALSLSQEFRFNENATIFDKSHTTIGAEYDFNKHIRVRAMYRYTQNRTLKNGFKVAHRPIVDFVLRDKYKRFSFDYRLRYQMDYEKDFTGEALYMESQAIRNRFSVKYNIRKNPITPTASYEFLYRLNNPYGNSIERNRFTFGLDYKISKALSANIYYRYQASAGNRIDAKNYYILGFGMGYSF